MGKTIILVGVIIVIIGVLYQFTQFNFDWFGKLPGDIRYEKTNFKLYVPISSMLIVSIGLSGLIWLLKKFNL